MLVTKGNVREVEVPDQEARGLAIGDRVKVSYTEIGTIRSISLDEHARCQVLVDYVSGSGVRTEEWWYSDRVNKVLPN